MNPHPPAASQEKRQSSGLALVIVLFQLFAFGLWIGGPRIPGEEMARYCAVNLRFHDNVGHSLNCDFSEFLYAAADPAHVWEPESKRQSRPGAALLVWLATRPAVFLLDAVRDDSEMDVAFLDRENGGEIAFEIPRNDLAATYPGFALLNLAILALSCGLYMRLANGPPGAPGRFRTAAGLACIAVLVNNVTKQFLWSPHTQLFNILVPLSALYFFCRMREEEEPERLFLAAAILSGIGMLFYGNFILVVLAAGLAYVWRRRDAMRQSLRPWMSGMLAVALFAVPYTLWYGFIVLRNGEFFNYDVELFKGFVWLGETAQSEGHAVAARRLGFKLFSMLYSALLQGWGFALLLAGLVRWAKILSQKTGAPPPAAGPLWAGAIIYITIAALFYAFYGLTVQRLSFTLIVPLFPLIGFYLDYIERRLENPQPLRRTALACACAYTLFMIVKFGPYS